MTTGEPGTEAQVTNSGTENNAVLNFVIPRGESGSSGELDVLSTVNTSSQTTAARGALTFHNNSLISGTAITHQAGSPDVIITKPGIYQAAFHGVATVNCGTELPASIRVQLYAGGTAVAGDTDRHTFLSSREDESLTFTAPFQVTTVPKTLRVIADSEGFTFQETSLTVTRLGDATAQHS